MTEHEYIDTTNLVKISAAKTILRDVLCIENGGINKEEFGKIVEVLCYIEAELITRVLLSITPSFRSG